MRITITVDPTVTPDDVADAYRQARSHFVDPKKARTQDTKRLALAVFCDRGPTDESWSQTLKRWNKRLPDWRCRSDDVFNFHRHASAARQRLLQPPSRK